MDTYTPEQFAKSLVIRGYMSDSKAKKYVADHPKEIYQETDFEDAYHDANKECMRSEPIKGLTSDGRNKFDPQYWGKWY